MSEKVSSNSKKVGRPAVDYPDGWKELCASWRAGDVTAREFMQKAGLKKGTFYSLVSEWSAMDDWAVSCYQSDLMDIISHKPDLFLTAIMSTDTIEEYRASSSSLSS